MIPRCIHGKLATEGPCEKCIDSVHPGASESFKNMLKTMSAGYYQSLQEEDREKTDRMTAALNFTRGT